MEKIERAILLLHKKARPENDGRLSYSPSVVRQIHDLLAEHRRDCNDIEQTVDKVRDLGNYA